MQPGIYHDLTNEEYHAGPGLSRSRLVPLLEGTPLDFHQAEPVEETPAMRLGTAAHLAILEPARFAALVRPQPKWDRRTKEGKKAAAEWADANPGAIGVPEDEYMAACEAARLVRAKKGPATALREGKTEASLYWEHDGILLKSRPDFFDCERGIAVDVKSTSRELDDRQVVRILVDQHAAMQAAMVTAGALALIGRRLSTYLLVVRLAPPIDMRLVHIGGFGEGEPLEWLEFGEAQLMMALKRYRECASTNTWPGWADRGVTYTEAPNWVRSQTESLTRGLAAADTKQ